MFAAILIPNFSLQSVLRHEPELDSLPVALTDPGSGGPEIVQVNPAAKTFGVTEGLTASQAMARCGNLTIKTRSRVREETATEILLQTAYAFSPTVEATAPGVCTLDLKGLAVDSAPVPAWCEQIRQALAQFRLDARIGLAATPALALLAARGAEPVAIVAHTDDFVSGLPLAALEPPREISEILARWGIRTVGQFVALGKNEVAERLGPPALALLARVSPDSLRPLKPAPLPESFSERMEFEPAVETAAPLLFVLRRLVEQLVRRLETIYLVVAEFELQLGLASGAKYERHFKIPSPTGNLEILFRMLQTHLETVRTDSPIVWLQLAAAPARPEAHQFGLFESTLRDPNQFAETLARLIALVGADNAGSPVVNATHQPDSFRMAAPDFDKIENAGGPAPDTAGRAPASGFTSLQLRRFRPPLAAQFEFRQEKPVLLHSEIFTGALAGSRGPFFSSGNWWDDQRWAREEWDVEAADGPLFRIFRSGDGCFVEGIYD